MKNIPLPGKHEFILSLMDKIVVVKQKDGKEDPLLSKPLRLITESETW